MMVLVGPFKLSIFYDFMINFRNLMQLGCQVLVGESCQAGSERAGMVLAGSLFCLQLLVIVNTVCLLFNFPCSVLDLITEMPDIKTTRAMFLVSKPCSPLSRPEVNRERAGPILCING